MKFHTVSSPADLDLIDPIGMEFSEIAKEYPGTDFNLHGFKLHWGMVLAANNGCVIYVMDDDKSFAMGAIAGVIHMSPFNGRFVASECFWYVLKDHRRGGIGKSLLSKFEDWAKSCGVSEVNMSALPFPGPVTKFGSFRQMSKFYEGNGYRRSTVVFSKEVK